MPAGRPKTFDEKEVLEAAMQLFWLRGYEAVSLSELVAAMGISRQSLYDTFGNKRELFVRSILHYRETQLSQALGLLQRSEAPLDNVKALLNFFQELAVDESCRGCLVANTLVELGPHDEAIGGMLREILDLLEEELRATLELAKQTGDLGSGKSPVELSRALLNAVIGMSVTGKLRPGREALADIYSGTLSMLD